MILHHRGISLVEQNHESECGLAVAAMLLRYHGYRVTLLDLEERYGVPRGGTSFSNLSSIFEDFNIGCKGIRILNIEDLKSYPNPLICHWNGDHFVVLEGYHRGLFRVFDPATGKLNLTESELSASFTGCALSTTQSEALITSMFNQLWNQSIVKIVKKLSSTIGSIIALTVLIQIISLVLVIAQQWAIDNLSVFSALPITGVPLALGFLFLSYYLLQRSRVLCLTKFQLFFEKESLYGFMEKMVDFSMKFFTIHGSGDLLFRVNSAAVIQQILSQRVLLASVDLCFAVFYFATMLLFSPFLTLVVTLITVIISTISIVYSMKNRELVTRSIHREVAAQDVLVEYFEGIETFKSLGIERQIINRWKNKFSEKQDFDFKKGKLAANLNTVYNALNFILPISLLCIGLQLSVEQKVSLGTVISFMALASSFITPVTTVLESFSQMLMAKSYLVKVSEILDRQNSLLPLKTTELQTSVESVTLDHVSFRYSEFDPLCIKDLSISISKGEHIAIVGPSGSGKSTILKLLSGMFSPYEGSSQINGIAMKSLSKDSICKRLAYCSQNSTVFAGTILENITLGKTLNESDLIEVADICEHVGLTDLLMENPMGIYSNIAKGGVNLSGGQRQKLVIARAIFSGADFLLLDEPTSALDNISEAKIFDYLSAESRTVVIVAHRLETIKQFDKIYVMDKGRVVDSGSHTELINRGGLYSELYR